MFHSWKVRVWMDTWVTIFCVFCVYLLPRWFEMVLTQCDFPCTALNVKAARIRTNAGKRQE